MRRQTDIGVLITGAARRIGRAIALDLAEHGFSVAIHCDHSRDDADELAATINSGPGKAQVLDADLTDEPSCLRLVEEAAAVVGPLRIIVNNASVFEQDSVTDFSSALWDRHFAIHVKAPALMAQAFARSLPADAKGLIVNMIDQRVWRPNPRFFSYTLSKAALWTATQTMAQALAPRIRVNAIGPGPTLANARQDEASFNRQIDGLILKRGPELPEFGATIRYLWETPSITGQMIALDGGQHLAWETPDIAGVTE